MNCSMPNFPVLRYLLESTHVHWVGDTIQPSQPLLPTSPPAVSLSQYQDVFQWVGSSYQVAKVLEFSFNISPSNEYSGLISFRIAWFDLPAVEGILKSLLQHLNSEALILQCLAFFIVQLSYPYMTIRKTIALTIQIFVRKVMSRAFLWNLS